MRSAESLDTFLGIPNIRAPRGSPSGRYVAYLSNEEGLFEPHILDLEADDRRTIAGMPQERVHPITSLKWGRTDDRLYFTVDPCSQALFVAEGFENTRKLVFIDDRCKLWEIGPEDRFVYYQHLSEDGWYLSRFDTQKDSRQTVVEYSQIVTLGGGAVDPTGEYIVYQMAPPATPEKSHVYLANADGTDPQRLPVTQDRQSIQAVAWRPSTSQVLLTDTATQEIGLFDLSQWTTNWLDDVSARPVTFFPDGTTILLQTGPRSIGIYDLADGTTEIDLDLPAPIRFDPTVSRGALAGTDRIIVQTVTAEVIPEELYAYSPSSGEHERLVEGDLGDLSQGDIIRPEEVTFHSVDDQSLSGLVYASNCRPSPVVVLAQRQSGSGLSRHVQLLVDAGYTVFDPELPETVGPNPHLTAAGDWISQKDWIDEERIAVYGQSHGGANACLAMMSGTDLWAGGISAAAPTDLLAWEEESTGGLVPLYRRYGDPEENAETWRDKSVISYVDGFSGPLLVLHGTCDQVGPVTQARLLKDALLEREYSEGIDFEYVELDGQAHYPFSVQEKVEKWETILDFLDRRL